MLYIMRFRTQQRTLIKVGYTRRRDPKVRQDEHIEGGPWEAGEVVRLPLPEDLETCWLDPGGDVELFERQLINHAADRWPRVPGRYEWFDATDDDPPLLREVLRDAMPALVRAQSMPNPTREPEHIGEILPRVVAMIDARRQARASKERIA